MKHDISKHPCWSYDEFIAFLLLYAAKSNLEFVDEEREMILKVVSKDVLRRIEKEYYDLTDFERIQVINAYKAAYYPTPALKSEVLHRIKHLFTADGEYDTLEKNMLLMLGRIL